MERLTERFSNGQAAVYGCGNNCKYDFKYCNNHLEDCPTINEIYEKLAAYEDLEEQGLLLKLPCKVGDTVYYTHPEHLDGKVEEYTVTGFCFDKQGCQIRTYSPKGVIIYFYLDFIGKTVFLTQTEAEEALKGMEGETK